MTRAAFSTIFWFSKSRWAFARIKSIDKEQYVSAIEFVYKRFVRPRIFAKSEADAEIAHEWGLRKLKLLQEHALVQWLARRILVYCHPMLETTVFGIRFPNPFGLAAGFDKYCEVYSRGIPACGWGFCEVGGITRYAQPGNDRPPARMLRSENLHALWNFMGFNNPGADAIADRYPAFCPIPVGLNVGKSKVTPIAEAARDYAYTIGRLWHHVKFITVNPSSPNTPGLRDLQKRDLFAELIRAAQAVNEDTGGLYHLGPKPLGVKISPDESDEQIADIVDVCRKERVSFIVATNTTVGREGCDGWNILADRGGVSGAPLAVKARRVLRELRKELKGEIVLIGVGGICDGATLYERILDGANLCQAYTAWPFEGPDFVKRALKTLVERLKVDGFENVAKAVGAKV